MASTTASASKKHSTLASALVLYLAACCCGGCCIQYAEQEVQLRYNLEDDSADLLLIYKGVTASEEGEKTVEDAAAVVLRLLEGRRVFDAPFGHFDLDDPELYEEGADPLQAEVASGVALLDWGVFLDDAERLAGWQRFRLAGASRVFDLLNRKISLEVLKASEEVIAFAKETPLLDDRSRELWRERAASGEPWVYFADGEIEVDLPMTPEAWDRVQAFMVAEAAKADGDDALRLVAQLLLHLRHFEIGEERVVFTLGAPVTGIYRFSVKHAEVKYSPKLKEALAACGVRFEAPDLTVESKTALEGVQAKLGLQPR